MKKKTVTIPDAPIKAVKRLVEPLIAWVGRGDDDDGRDVMQPIGYDSEGRPLYAPPGIAFPRR